MVNYSKIRRSKLTYEILVCIQNGINFSLEIAKTLGKHQSTVYIHLRYLEEKKILTSYQKKENSKTTFKINKQKIVDVFVDWLKILLKEEEDKLIKGLDLDNDLKIKLKTQTNVLKQRIEKLNKSESLKDILFYFLSPKRKEFFKRCFDREADFRNLEFMFQFIVLLYDTIKIEFPKMYKRDEAKLDELSEIYQILAKIYHSREFLTSLLGVHENLAKTDS